MKKKVREISRKRKHAADTYVYVNTRVRTDRCATYSLRIRRRAMRTAGQARQRRTFFCRALFSTEADIWGVGVWPFGLRNFCSFFWESEKEHSPRHAYKRTHPKRVHAKSGEFQSIFG